MERWTNFLIISLSAYCKTMKLWSTNNKWNSIISWITCMLFFFLKIRVIQRWEWSYCTFLCPRIIKKKCSVINWFLCVNFINLHLLIILKFITNSLNFKAWAKLVYKLKSKSELAYMLNFGILKRWVSTENHFSLTWPLRISTSPFFRSIAISQPTT